MSDEKKLETIKQNKLTTEKVQYLIQKLDKIKQSPLVEEMTISGETITTERTLLTRLIELQTLLLEIQLANIQNSLAMEHKLELATEASHAQMNDRMMEMLKRMGLDADTFKKMFGS
jgi:flagellar biosynthesis/type III secretory pathway chaperone